MYDLERELEVLWVIILCPRLLQIPCSDILIPSSKEVGKGEVLEKGSSSKLHESRLVWVKKRVYSINVHSKEDGPYGMNTETHPLKKRRSVVGFRVKECLLVESVTSRKHHIDIESWDKGSLRIVLNFSQLIQLTILQIKRPEEWSLVVFTSRDLFINNSLTDPFGQIEPYRTTKWYLEYLIGHWSQTVFRESKKRSEGFLTDDIVVDPTTPVILLFISEGTEDRSLDTSHSQNTIGTPSFVGIIRLWT